MFLSPHKQDKKIAGQVKNDCMERKGKEKKDGLV